jgi:hypothetical protein
MPNSGTSAPEIKIVFVMAMENHNWTQPADQFTGGIQPIYQNPNAPFINSLVDGAAYGVVNGSLVHMSEQVAYATNYHNVPATPGLACASPVNFTPSSDLRTMQLIFRVGPFLAMQPTPPICRTCFSRAPSHSS